MSTAALVQELKDAGQDHEFYPTTDEIIAAVIKDLKRSSSNFDRLSSVLDIGAGNGKVLKALHHQADVATCFAIEKSPILCRQLMDDVLVIGTAFEEQTLFEKRVDITFCNPPYSVFEDWTEKIIRQSASKVVYLVIPERWIKSVRIQDAIRYREAQVKSLGDFDFEDAEDRQARAKVQLLRVEFQFEGCRRDGDDAFDRFFKEQFKGLIDAYNKSEAEGAKEKKGSFGESPPQFKALTVGPTYPEALVALYQEEMARIQRNYELVGQLDPELMREFNIKPDTVRDCLRKRLADTKQKYWTELFGRLDAVTNKLTSASRKELLGTLHQHVMVDFTVDNILAVLVWVVKNANRYIDDQLVKVYELMVDKCNVHMYKSNTKTWAEDRWRYNVADMNDRYALDYRIVMHRCGGIRKTEYSFDKGLEERAAEFLGDLLTLAHNLGYVSFGRARDVLLRRDSWTSGTTVMFRYCAGESQKLLFDVKAFFNGNMHIRLNPDFILALNVEHGRLKGWIKTPAEAVEELQDEKAAACFNSMRKLPGVDPRPLLGGGK